jgi:hypothetical protein
MFVKAFTKPRIQHGVMSDKRTWQQALRCFVTSYVQFLYKLAAIVRGTAVLDALSLCCSLHISGLGSEYSCMVSFMLCGKNI